MPKKKAIKDPHAYQHFAQTHDHCQACGIPAGAAYRLRWPGLSRHHIIKAGRSDDLCNLLMLCSRCHDLAELLTIRVDGVVLPTLPVGVCLRIKSSREPNLYNPARLQELRGRPLPDLLPIPDVIDAEYRRWRPWVSFPLVLTGVNIHVDRSRAQALPPGTTPAGAGSVCCHG